MTDAAARRGTLLGVLSEADKTRHRLIPAALLAAIAVGALLRLVWLSDME